MQASKVLETQTISNGIGCKGEHKRKELVP